jgi:molybdopterin/thiamine biosynthesis adenylyltransferase
VGTLTIIDPYMVTRADLGKNFFVDGESVGRPRADVCASLLSELNELATVKSAREACTLTTGCSFGLC